MKAEDNQPACPKEWQAWLIAGAVFVFLIPPVSEMNHWLTWDAAHWALNFSCWMVGPFMCWLNLQAIKRHLAGKEHRPGLLRFCRWMAILAALPLSVLGLLAVGFRGKTTTVEAIQSVFFTSMSFFFWLTARRLKALPQPSSPAA